MPIDTTKGGAGTTGPSATTGDLEARLSKAADWTVKSIMKAVTLAGRLAEGQQDRVADAVGKAGDAFDKRTQGKYAPKVAKVSQAVNDTVAWTARQQH